MYNLCMTRFALYIDYLNHNDVLRRRLLETQAIEQVLLCDAEDIQQNILVEKHIDVLVIPGGADLYFCEKLDGHANAVIKDFVEKGGAYLGICAGAYYACQELEFAKHIPDEAICGTREVSFHAGKAIGPVFEFIQDSDFYKSWDAPASIEYQAETFKVVYRGGPWFTEGHAERVLARYADLKNTPAAIIEVDVGKGKAILCGPHIEYLGEDYLKGLYRHNNSNFLYEEKIADQVMPYNAQIKKLWDDIIKHLID